MIDLQKFCGKEPTRPYLHRPFSSGDYTYASNGHIMVRVPRLPDVAEIDPEYSAALIMRWDGPLEGWNTATYSAVKFDLPPKTLGEECDLCDGAGHEHECPSCTCECERCHGTGQLDSDHGVSADLRGAPVMMRYVRLLAETPGLTGLQFMESHKEGTPILFKFDGGIGAVMPLRIPFPKTVNISGQAA